MNDKPTLKQHDECSMWRCPQLGGSVTFEYCRRMNKTLPCFNLFRCWGNELDLQTWLTENFSQEEIQQAMTKPANIRIDSIFDVLQSMKKSAD
ncbi:MAG: hypothetical protein P9L94_16020 [Candidatus Hinthialibacter antarcticus]|nr:hypothetical protein [Candidatus Hinthialibacter antarcticus]